MIKKYLNIIRSASPTLEEFDVSTPWREGIYFYAQWMPGYIGRVFRRRHRRMQDRRAVKSFEVVLSHMGPGGIAIDAGAHTGQITKNGQNRSRSSRV